MREPLSYPRLPGEEIVTTNSQGFRCSHVAFLCTRPVLFTSGLHCLCWSLPPAKSTLCTPSFLLFWAFKSYLLQEVFPDDLPVCYKEWPSCVLSKHHLGLVLLTLKNHPGESASLARTGFNLRHSPWVTILTILWPVTV